MSKSYAVAAAACYVTVPGVGSVLLYRDAPVPESAENLEELEAEGFIVEVGEDALGGMQSDIPPDLDSPAEPLSPAVLGDEGAPVDDVDGDGPIPPKSATKDVWIDYAVTVEVAKGTDEATARAAAEALTKDQLIEQYGAVA